MLKESLLKFLRLDGILANLTGYVETRIELMKLEIKEDVSKTLAKASVFLAVAIVLSLFVLFISMAVAYKISEYTTPFAGFSIVAGIYLLAGIIVWVSRDSLQKKLEQQFSEKIKIKKK